MMFGIVEMIILLVAVIGSGVMSAFLVWFIGRLRALERGLQDKGDVPALSAQIAALQGEVDSLQGTVQRLTERAEFTERLLEEKTGEL